MLRNQPTLIPDYQIPNHSEDLARLKEIHDRYRRQQTVTAGVAVTTGAAVTGDLWYASENPEYSSKTHGVINFVDDILNS